MDREIKPDFGSSVEPWTPGPWRTTKQNNGSTNRRVWSKGSTNLHEAEASKRNSPPRSPAQ